jgi:rhodanese-related sulfurtransferase
VIPDVPGPLTLELPAFKQLYDASAALVVDARETSQYAEGHIAGAVSLPYNGALAEPEKVAALEPARRPIVVYCSGGTCEVAMDLAKFLIESGKRRVLVYAGGYPEWLAAGYPVARGMAEGVRP